MCNDPPGFLMVYRACRKICFRDPEAVFDPVSVRTDADHGLCIIRIRRYRIKTIIFFFFIDNSLINFVRICNCFPVFRTGSSFDETCDIMSPFYKFRDLDS